MMDSPQVWAVKMTDEQNCEVEVKHYADGDVMVKQGGGSGDMVYIPSAMYGSFMEALKRPLSKMPMPWCERCQCYHHDTADHVS